MQERAVPSLSPHPLQCGGQQGGDGDLMVMLVQEMLPPELWRTRLTPVPCLSVTHCSSSTATHLPSPSRDQSPSEDTTERFGISEPCVQSLWELSMLQCLSLVLSLSQWLPASHC